MMDDVFCVALIELLAFNRTWFCFLCFGLHCFIRTLSFDPALRSGFSLHIEEEIPIHDYFPLSRRCSWGRTFHVFALSVALPIAAVKDLVG